MSQKYLAMTRIGNSVVHNYPQAVELYDMGMIDQPELERLAGLFADEYLLEDGII